MDVALLIRKRCNDLNLSITQLAVISGVSRKNIYKILDGNRLNPRLDTVLKLAEALKLHPYSLFQGMVESTKIPAYPAHAPLLKHDGCGFVADMTYPDNTRVKAGEYFIKTWLIQNIGNLHWRGRFLQCMDEQSDGSLAEKDLPPPPAII